MFHVMRNVEVQSSETRDVHAEKLHPLSGLCVSSHCIDRIAIGEGPVQGRDNVIAGFCGLLDIL